ncbi:MAG: hypothetical protein GTN62_11925 [Gemmatimonadales bacterium]|nr:hypothetical protein [Gemmatimonadales bacterium]NIN12427.1 hypothetical protein [Gemmatimonadales bacterium]NIN50803.1 hypothetical protein [Gemmatimonadales bacterium]NIP08267.1 hypothetical protein [Gemmatimonadales bacterium]NIR00791.1 hypothetical protein [Gemmatimonadales bacterium]
MMKKLGWIAAVCLTAGCLTGPEGVVLVAIDPEPPSVTSSDTLEIAGQVIRSPIRQPLVFTVTVTGGAATVDTVTSEFGLFVIGVPLTKNAENRLVLTARDVDGNVSQPREITVTHQESAT